MLEHEATIMANGTPIHHLVFMKAERLIRGAS
jgi:hypothetical protein